MYSNEILESLHRHGFSKRLRSVIAKNPEWAFWYTVNVLKGPWKIAKDPKWALEYAKKVLKDPNPETWAERSFGLRNE